MIIQYASDIHRRSFDSFEFLPCRGDMLILAGDCVCFKNMDTTTQLLQYCAKNWKIILYVPGNHDFRFYNYSIADMDNFMIKLFADYNNIHYLNNNSIEINNITFSGSCLWSDMEGVDINSVNDSNYLYVNNRLIMTNDIIKLYDESVDFFKQSIIPGKSICISHFPPIDLNVVPERYTLISNETNKYQKKNFNYYTGRLYDKLDSLPLKWIYGHSHYSHVQTVEGCEYLSNQLGFVHEFGTTGFNGEKTFHI